MKTFREYEEQAKEYFHNIGEKIPTSGALGAGDSKRDLDTTINSMIMLDLLNAITNQPVEKEEKKVVKK
ncbi:MAG: hypothetical protein ACRCRT_00960 [Cetobacterium somerae]